ncbi:MAG: response regulator [Deltaproteobacteria bacterium]|nr:MAG: response regulator [Deltaproteobacteria bacterium]
MMRCGMYELVVDLRGEIIGVGSGAAALFRLPPDQIVGRPVTRFLRGPAMTASYGTAAAVTIKAHGRGNTQGTALRALEDERIHITLLPTSSTAVAAPAAPRLRTIERLVDEVVRDVQNPLTGIMGFSALAQLAPTPHRRRYYLDQVATQAQRCRRLLQSLDASVRAVTPYPSTTDLAEQASLTVSTARLQLEGHGISVELSLPKGPVWVETDPKLLGDALVCFIHRGTLGLRKEYTARDVLVQVLDPPGGAPRLTLELSGCDSPNNALRERFSLEPTASVSSLSDVEFLAACDTLREQGCTLRIAASDDGEMVRVVVELPRAGSAPRTVDQTRTPVPLDILAIDDDAMMGELYQELLGVSGHTVTSCRTLLAAREALRTQRFDAVIADFFLSDGTFSELWAEAADQHPELTDRVVLITGDRSHAQVREWLQRGRTPVLPKPFTTQSLLSQITLLTA